MKQILTDKLSVFFCLIFFINFIFPSLLFAQKSKVDSLLLLLNNTKSDTNKINHLNALGWEMMYVNPDTSVILSNQAFDLAEKLKWKKGKSNSFGNLGVYYWLKADYPKALDYYLKTLKILEEIMQVFSDANDKGSRNFSEKQITQKGLAACLGNIGNIYLNQGEYLKALDYYLKALKIDKEIGNNNGMARHFGNIGTVYHEQGNYPKALDYYLKALKMDKELGVKTGVARHLGNIGFVYMDLAEGIKVQSVKHDSLLKLALDYYLNALKLDDELGNRNGMARHLSNISQLYTKTGKYKEAEQYLKKSITINDSIGAMNSLRQDEESLSQLYDTTGKYKLALIHYKKAMALKDSVFSEDSKKQLIRKEMTYQFEKKEAVAKAEQDKKEAVAVAEKKKQQLILLLVSSFLLVVLLFSGFIFKERKKSEKLLLNILPAETARELKSKGKASPKYYEMTTVMFTDFKDFTQISEKMSANELVAELDYIFKNFDVITSKYPIEKIKTIGDSYMCAGGLPTPNTTNHIDVVFAALDIKMFMEEYKQKRISEDKPFFEVRIGVHTGAVVAGVVGEKKFAYDIWGDAVNTASRMESSGEVGKVNISGETYKHHVETPCTVSLQFTFRGKIPAKNKGEVEMYFVERESE